MSNLPTLLPMGLLSLGLTFLPPQDEAISIATIYAEGQVLETSSVIEFSSEVTSFTMTRDGEEVDMGDRMTGGPTTMTRTTYITDEYLSVKDGKPTSVRRTFDTLEGSSLRSMGGEEVENTSNGPLEGVTIELSIDTDDEDAEVEVTVVEGTEPDDEALLEGHILALGLDAMLPPGEVEVDTKWDFDGAVLMGVLGLDLEAQLFPPQTAETDGGRGEGGGRRRGGRRGSQNLAKLLTDAEWEGEATLTGELVDIEGLACHVIEFTAEGEVEIEDPPAREPRGEGGGDAEGLALVTIFGGTGTLEMEGKLFVSVDEGRPVGLEAESTVTVDTETTRSGGMGEIVITSTTETSLTIEITIVEGSSTRDE